MFVCWVGSITIGSYGLLIVGPKMPQSPILKSQGQFSNWHSINKINYVTLIFRFRRRNSFLFRGYLFCGTTANATNQYQPALGQNNKYFENQFINGV